MLTRLQYCDASSSSAEIEPPFFYSSTFAFSTQASLRATPARSFATLFGAFPVQVWRDHANIRRVGIRVLSPGAPGLVVRMTQDDGLTRDIPSRHDATTDIHWCDLSPDLSGILYPVVESDGPAPQIEYVTDAAPAQPVRLAVVIPTFKREIQVIRNATAIAAAAQNASHIRVFVVDNGNTLAPDAFAGFDNISLIGNRNLGGAGGFARGMIEACAPAGGFTHVVMCDDDADIHPESILRCAAFFSYCTKKVYVGGTMLVQHERTHVHESGAKVTGPYGFYSCKQGLQVSDPVNLAQLCTPEPIEYFGWYLVGYSVSAIADQGLPEPFFIRFDDQEFGLRLLTRGYEAVTLLGFCVWHEAFHLRDSQVTHYYLARNGIIALLLHRPGYSAWRYTRQLAKEFFNSLYTLRYDRASFILDGITDALKGPGFLLDVDEEELNTALFARQTTKIGRCEPDSLDGEWFQVRPPRHRRKNRMIARLTLGGHLLPGNFTRKHTCHYINSMDVSDTVSSEKAFFYEPITELGWIATRDRARFFKLLGRGLAVLLRLQVEVARIGTAFRAAEPDLVSFKHWHRRLHLPYVKEGRDVTQPLATRVEAPSEPRARAEL